MPEYSIQSFTYRLKHNTDLSWVNAWGQIFSVFDQTGSGCICFGIERDGHQFFMKIAGADTETAEISPEESIALLERAYGLYEELAHPALITAEDAFLKNGLFAALFEWAEGECLFDHWNFDRYKSDPSIITPKQRFSALPFVKKAAVCEQILSFIHNCTAKGYVPVDFYDASLIYDFKTDTVKFCDIDLFRKMPLINETGEAYWGTKRLKAPEEHIKGSVIDERTAVFTSAALCTELLSEPGRVLTRRRYEQGHFIPVPYVHFSGPKNVYDILRRATKTFPDERYQTMEDLYRAFVSAVRSIA